MHNHGHRQAVVDAQGRHEKRPQCEQHSVRYGITMTVSPGTQCQDTSSCKKTTGRRAEFESWVARTRTRRGEFEFLDTSGHARCACSPDRRFTGTVRVSRP